jgi:hypothetical protein
LFCLPADRPHDPGDAADLSIMGYLSPFQDLYLYGAKFARKREKINNFLMIKNPDVTLWLKSALASFPRRQNKQFKVENIRGTQEDVEIYIFAITAMREEVCFLG